MSELIERLKAWCKDCADNKREQSLRKLLKEVIAALSVAPAPVAADKMSNAEKAAREECETLEWRQDMVNPTQVVALLQQFQFIERPLDVPAPLIAAARYAIQYLQERVKLLRSTSPPVQEGPKGVEELPRGLVEDWEAEAEREGVMDTEYVAQKAVEWARQRSPRSRYQQR